MELAAVRDLRPQLRLETPDEVGAFEQDLLAEFVLARASAGITDTTISADVAAVVGLREWFGRPLWEMTARDLDRFFGADRRALAPGTKVRKAAASRCSSSSWNCGTARRSTPPPGSWWSRRWMRSTGRAAGPARGCGSRRMRGRSKAVHRLADGHAHRPEVRPGRPELHRDAAGQPDRPAGAEAVPLDDAGRVLGAGAVREDPAARQGQPGPGEERPAGAADQRVARPAGMVAGGPRWEFDDRVNDPAAPLFPSERRHGDGSSRPVTDDALRLGLAEAVARICPARPES